jgi:hypothetical protein
VFHNASPEIDVRRSATGTTPASVCVSVEGQSFRVTTAAPTVTWTPDPGTPG